jgi:type II secretion system protein G
MAKQRRGFTLIELLMVVAIIGILAALLIPLAMDSIQKAKQKGTIKDINSIAAAITDYITDNGRAPGPQAGDLVGGSAFYASLSGFYLKVLPQNDQWGTAFQIYTGTAADSCGYTNVTNNSADDFVVASFGRDKGVTAFPFDPMQPTTAYFDITGMASFNEDLVNWDGSWVHIPKASQVGATT